MKRTFLILGIFISISTFAQREEKIEYYTDSDVRNQIFSIGVRYDPYFTSRTLLTGSVLPSQEYYFLNSSTTGRFGNAYGIDLFFRLNERLDLGVGFERSTGGYTWDFIKILQTTGTISDTVDGDFAVDVDVSYLSIPFRFNFSTQMNDLWALEVAPVFEVNFLEKLNYDLRDSRNIFTPEQRDSIGFGDQKENARQVNYTIGVEVGGRYFITENLSLHMMGILRYMLQPLTENFGPRETLLRYGGSFGLRYRF
ncbi:MAG: hypothetical protein LPK80_12880 [Bacteroidota bacterium]|nr:hypothetical protein [Bacteroidota bacterium]MDX5404057.1 hypothetical protein [Bacteroidota bacterium]MDX5429253.1 hypothetical protein [Bacteroidota bacterium]MDX5448484.1 hypothetical protein [Bacteroidota bacterium]MDX5506875.1 hypothetical protein [Bacteroidota bacterium]